MEGGKVRTRNIKFQSLKQTLNLKRKKEKTKRKGTKHKKKGNCKESVCVTVRAYMTDANDDDDVLVTRKSRDEKRE